MKNKQDLSRRDFIRNSVMAGGAVGKEISIISGQKASNVRAVCGKDCHE
mgnify:CR=1 FL=1